MSRNNAGAEVRDGAPARREGNRRQPESRPKSYELVKVVLDAALAAALLTVTAPLLLLVAALVVITSRGPVLYTQRRVGRNRVPFTMYKFRTMEHDCERLTGPRWSTPDDPRITAVGRLLRRSHLDEVPQLWNVLRGEMSLVGPRPERPEFVRQLEKSLPDYAGRLRVRPGITGLAQVQLPPDSDLESVRRKLICDLDYVDRLGPWLDLRILLATALFLVGLPFSVSTRALGLRTRGLETEGPAAEQDVGLVPRPQPAWHE